MMAQNTSNIKIEAFEGLFKQDGKYGCEFQETEIPIGRGTFGCVFKAKHRIDDKEYAIKKILISNSEDFKKIIKELRVWAKLDCDYFVQYRSSWVEDYDEENLKQLKELTYDETDSAKPGNYSILHIQMDLCSFTLKDAMTKVNEHFSIPKGGLLTPIGYYIASELLIEILESINYLHNQNIIHRDLKPSNILISKGINGKFVKISDFGIATFHDQAEQSHTQLTGTIKYMAPELLNSRKYDTKVDIYSIGVITQEMFNVDINRTVITSDDRLLLNKYQNIMNLINQSMSIVKNNRPNCDVILNDKHLWAYNFEDILQDRIIKDIIKEDIIKDLNQVYDMNNNFVNNFIQNKYKSPFTNQDLLNHHNIRQIHIQKLKSMNQKSLEKHRTTQNTNSSLINIASDQSGSSFPPQASTPRRDYTEKIFADLVCEDKYHKEFIEEDMIGNGSFGIVCRAKHKVSGKYYAIKKLRVKDSFKNYLLREIEIMSEEKSDYIVKHKLSWIENSSLDFETYKKHKNKTFNSKHEIFINSKDPLLFIQMELCTESLKTFIINLGRIKSNVLTSVEYFIACEILNDILEGVNFLHKRATPIIHRDLKPSNIIISESSNSINIKLADFGLARVHDPEDLSLSQFIGDIRYMAPEVWTSKKYDSKADIFSLGKITMELFNLTEEPTLDHGNDGKILRLYEEIFRISQNMMSPYPKTRLSSEEIQNEKNLWAIERNELSDTDFQDFNLSNNITVLNFMNKRFLMYESESKSK